MRLPFCCPGNQEFGLIRRHEDLFFGIFGLHFAFSLPRWPPQHVDEFAALRYLPIDELQMQLELDYP